jgi:hypothetical protein
MSCSIQYTLIVEPFKRELLAMLHIVQSCQATNHGQERQYADRNNCENKDFISLSRVSTESFGSTNGYDEGAFVHLDPGRGCW